MRLDRIYGFVVLIPPTVFGEPGWKIDVGPGRCEVTVVAPIVRVTT